MERKFIFWRRKLGIKPFPQYGDLDKALKGVPEDAIKVLMRP